MFHHLLPHMLQIPMVICYIVQSIEALSGMGLLMLLPPSPSYFSSNFHAFRRCSFLFFWCDNCTAAISCTTTSYVRTHDTSTTGRPVTSSRYFNWKISFLDLRMFWFVQILRLYTTPAINNIHTRISSQQWKNNETGKRKHEHNINGWIGFNSLAGKRAKVPEFHRSTDKIK